MGRSAHGQRWSGLRYSNQAMTWLGALFAPQLLAPAQPVTIAVVDTGANVRVPEIAAKRPAHVRRPDAWARRSRSERPRHGRRLDRRALERQCAPADHPRGQLERRVQRRERGGGDPVRGRPRRSHREPQPRRTAHLERGAIRRPLRDRPACSSSPPRATTTPAVRSTRPRCSERTVSRSPQRCVTGRGRSSRTPVRRVSVAAPGETGTSFATPLVSAAAALSGRRIRASRCGRSSDCSKDRLGAGHARRRARLRRDRRRDGRCRALPPLTREPAAWTFGEL